MKNDLLKMHTCWTHYVLRLGFNISYWYLTDLSHFPGRRAAFKIIFRKADPTKVLESNNNTSKSLASLIKFEN